MCASSKKHHAVTHTCIVVQIMNLKVSLFEATKPLNLKSGHNDITVNNNQREVENLKVYYISHHLL